MARTILSVREGVINAFHYGNQEKPEKKIHLAIELTEERMIIHVLDEGKGFRLTDVPDPLAQENLLSTSGRGIFLMKAFMDEFDVHPGKTGGAELVMAKRLPAMGSPHSNGNGSASNSGAPPSLRSKAKTLIRSGNSSSASTGRRGPSPRGARSRPRSSPSAASAPSGTCASG